MIIVDTNVVSEPLYPTPNPRVAAWLAETDPEQLWLTSLTAAELWAGVHKLPRGRRRDTLTAQVAGIITTDFSDRVLPFDAQAAEHFGAIGGPILRTRRDVDLLDIQIAAIARSRGAAIATRNVKHFESFGVELINPWDY